MSNMFKPVETNLPAKPSFWSRCKAFWLQDAEEYLNSEFKVTLTPAQQKFEDDLNAFLYQEITWKQIRDFLFQEVSFGKKNKNAEAEATVEVEE